MLPWTRIVFVRPTAAVLMCLVLTPAGFAQDDAAVKSTPEVGTEPGDTPLEPERSFWTDWTGGVEFGLNGTEGNTNRVAFRAGFNLDRKTDKTETSLLLTYAYAQDNRVESQNQGLLFGRNDWLFSDSKWRWFVQAGAEYDQFQAWLWRFSGSTGPGYDFIRTDKTVLTGRAGLGFSQTVGGTDSDEFRPEGLLGLNWEQQLTERQKLTAFVSYLPAFNDFPARYRANGGANWEIMMDPETGLTLKIGVLDRYDSQPGAGSKRNQLEYFALLVWKF